MKKYRIKEFDGQFSIQILVERKTGKRRRKKTELEWRITSSEGKEWFPAWQAPSRSYSTLEEARDQIKSWEKGVTYHKP